MPHRKRPRMVIVDLERLLSLEHACASKCPVSQCCCGSYDVCVTRREMENIVGMMPAAARYCPHLEEDGGFDNVFEAVEGGCFSLETVESGLCVFAYGTRDGIRCALHSAAVEAGMPLHAAKPESCLLWPLALSEGEEPVLSVTEDALSFVCNRLRDPEDDGSSLSEGVLSILEIVFGRKAAEKANDAARNGRRRVKVRIE